MIGFTLSENWQLYWTFYHRLHKNTANTYLVLLCGTPGAAPKCLLLSLEFLGPKRANIPVITQMCILESNNT